jgi:hypothetical protein
MRELVRDQLVLLYDLVGLGADQFILHNNKYPVKFFLQVGVDRVSVIDGNFDIVGVLRFASPSFYDDMACVVRVVESWG